MITSTGADVWSAYSGQTKLPGAHSSNALLDSHNSTTGKNATLSAESSPMNLLSETGSLCSQLDLTATVTSQNSNVNVTISNHNNHNNNNNSSHHNISVGSAPLLPVPTAPFSSAAPHAGSAPTSAAVAATAVGAKEDPQRSSSIVQRNVYISGLPSYMQSSEFRELCLRFGPVEASKLCVEGPSNPTKGYGFVLYYTEASATACIKGLSGSYLNGRYLQARLADTHATPTVAKRRTIASATSIAQERTMPAHTHPRPEMSPPLNTAFSAASPPGSTPMCVGPPFSASAHGLAPIAEPMPLTQGVYYTCAVNQPLYSGAAAPMAVQPHTFVYAAPSPYGVGGPMYLPPAAPTAHNAFPAAAPPFGVYAGVSDASFGPAGHMLSPLMLSSAPPPPGVQYISLPPAPGSYPM